MSTNVCLNFRIDLTMLTLLFGLFISIKTCLDRQCIFMSPQQAQYTRKGFTLILTCRISDRRYLLTIMSCQRLTKPFIYFIKHGALAVFIDLTLFLHVFLQYLQISDVFFVCYLQSRKSSPKVPTNKNCDSVIGFVKVHSKPM